MAEKDEFELQDLQTAPLDSRFYRLPRLGFEKEPRKVFEGKVDFHIYSDRVHAVGHCVHCRTEVNQILHVRDPRIRAEMQKPGRAREAVLKQCADLIQRNHQCSMLFEGRDDIDDFFEKVGRA